ncbi:MAG: dienelactone hydrolase family protein [Pseudomonadota bacterium]
MLAAWALAACLMVGVTHAPAATPATVSFASADGKTELTGYLYMPDGVPPYPAIIMLHGRSGLYSSLKRGTYTAETLSARHRMWGELWAKYGYVALLVDSFGPRGHPAGFAKHSYQDRPGEVSERVVRPLDAYGALAYLRGRRDVIGDRVGLHGWSNGGMTVLSAMAADPPGLANPNPIRGFRAALAQYPSCRTQSQEAAYKPYAPLLVLAASDDDEVSPEVCRRFVQHMHTLKQPVELVMYEGAHHAYDDPGKTKQSHAPNRAALLDTQERAAAFFARHLRP